MSNKNKPQGAMHAQAPKQAANPNRATSGGNAEPFRTLGQRYAQAAWQAVNARINTIDKFIDDSAAQQDKKNKNGLACTQRHTSYRTRARSMPLMIHQCGLAQAVAFCQSRGSATDKEGLSDPHQYKAWLEDVEKVMSVQHGHLANHSRTAPLQTYMHLTHQVLHAASWIKSYAEALIERGDENDHGQGEDE